jgi:hypothetical protein
MSSAAAADADADQNGVRPIDSNWANDITEIEDAFAAASDPLRAGVCVLVCLAR